MSCLYLTSCGMIAFSIILCQLHEFAVAEISSNLISNGDFEEFYRDFHPAGVYLKSTASMVHDWEVRDGAVEIISSRLWEPSTPKSLYAVHLNTINGPGEIETRVLSAWDPTTKYILAFDVAASPGRGLLSVKKLQVDVVDVNPSEHNPRKSFTLSQGASRKSVGWKNVQFVFQIHESGAGFILKFRSLTPGSYGPLIDNVKLTRLHIDSCEDLVLDWSISDEIQDKTAIGLIIESFQMVIEWWILKIFPQRLDWW